MNTGNFVVMKDIILQEIKNVKSVCEDLESLRYEYNCNTFYYYWDYLTFINWLKANEPIVGESYDLDTYFEIIDDFGKRYIKLMKPLPTPFRYEDGILGISLPMNEMVEKAYQYAFNIQSDDKVSPIDSEVLDGLKSLAGMATNITEVVSKVNEVHAVQTGKLYKAKASTRLTAKQKKQAEADKEMEYLQSLRANAHRKIINGL